MVEDATGRIIVTKGTHHVPFGIKYVPHHVGGEECFQQAKGEAGLDHYQARTWRAWYAHITLSMLALAWLAASRAQAVKKGSGTSDPGMTGYTLARNPCGC